MKTNHLVCLVLLSTLAACESSTKSSSDSGASESSGDDPGDTDPGDTDSGDDTAPPSVWAGDVAASLPAVDVSWGTVESSSRIEVSWAADADAAAFQVQATVGDHSVLTLADGADTSVVLHGLRSETTYTVTVARCLSADCSAPEVAPSVDATTARMIWQIAGTASGYENAEAITENTNTKGFGLYMGNDAPESVRGTSQLYYDTNVSGNKGIRVAVGTAAPESVTELVDYTPLDDHGMLREPTGGGGTAGPQTHQAIPLASGAIRMLFEGVLHEEEGNGRLFYVDSQDGLIGRDFNSGTSTDCAHDEIITGGPCAPEVVLQNEDRGGLAGVEDVRQSKLLYPMFDNWLWDESAGSVIIATVHFTDDAGDCSETFFNMALAVSDGSSWSFSMDSDSDCPDVLSGVQAPMPSHMGDGRYMIIFSENQEAVMEMNTDKVLKVLYVDAASSGDATLIEMSDFETPGDAREVTTVWPDGTELSVDEEKKFDDYGIYSPTNDPEHLVMYTNMSCEEGSICEPFIGHVGWVNP